MSSPLHRAKSASLSNKSVLTSTYKGHLANSSEPVPFDFVHTSATPTDWPDPSRWAFDRQERISSPLGKPHLSHARSGSNFKWADISEERTSTGPSIMMASMSSMPELKQTSKKPGGIKATIRRMFGSKRERTSVNEVARDFHRSDPGNLITSNVQSRQPSSQGSSRPRNSLQKYALGSHAVNPATIIHDFESFNTLNKLQRQRRNTLPSLAFSDHEARSFTSRLGHLMNNDLGRAKLPDTIGTNKDKRKSKSTEALTAQYGIDISDASIRQDRDTEIAFWSNNTHLNSIPWNSLPGSIGQDRLMNKPSEDIKGIPSLEQILQPTQSFDFGLDNNVEEPMDLEERVGTLEVKMFDFEYAIAKLQGIDIPKPVLPMKKTRSKNVQQIHSKQSMQSLSTVTSEVDRPPITPGDSPLLTTSKEDLSIDRASKATTIRPFIRTDCPARGSMRLTAEQYDYLMGLIQDEKHARQLMELQIIDMQREIELLQAPVFATINYPKITPESRLSTQKKLHRSPPFHFSRQNPAEISRFSTTESDNESSEEVFQTPRERQSAFDTRKHSALIGLVS